MTVADIQAGLDARLARAHTLIPIVVVPGIMGSRLETPDGVMVWNPTFGVHYGNPAMDAVRLAQMDSPLVPWERRIDRDEYEEALSGAHGWRASDWDRRTVAGYHIAHFGALLDDFYGDLLLRLHFELSAAMPADMAPKIYCCGYDWRQTNVESAADLARIVGDARRECGGQQAIIIAHSMGGLVTRYFCRNLGGEARTRAVFLLGSPSMGAPKPYLMLKRGIPETELRFACTGILATEEQSRRLCRTMQSGYELCPNDVYCRAHTDWAAFNERGTGYPPTGPCVAWAQFDDTSDPERFYEDIFTGVQDVFDDRAEALRHMRQARAFHESLTSGSRIYMHPNTYCLYSPSMSTITALGFHATGQRHLDASNANVVDMEPTIAVATMHGDTAVPRNSAHPPAHQLTHPFVDAHELPGVEHVAMSNDPGAYNWIKMKIVEMLSA